MFGNGKGGKRKRSLKALKAYMDHGSTQKCTTSEIQELMKEDDAGLTALCFDAEEECRRLGIDWE